MLCFYGYLKTLKGKEMKGKEPIRMQFIANNSLLVLDKKPVGYFDGDICIVSINIF